MKTRIYAAPAVKGLSSYQSAGVNMQMGYSPMYQDARMKHNHYV